MDIGHPTTQIEDKVSSNTSNPVSAVVLTGPPLSGKTTIRHLFEDMGAVGVALETIHDNGSLPDGWEQTIDRAYENVLSQNTEADDASIPLCCFDDPTTVDEIETITDRFSQTIVVRVTAPSADRLKRHMYSVYHETVVSKELVGPSDVAKAEQSPNVYDVVLPNPDDVATSTIAGRCAKIAAVLTGESALDIAPELMHQS